MLGLGHVRTNAFNWFQHYAAALIWTDCLAFVPLDILLVWHRRNAHINGVEPQAVCRLSGIHHLFKRLYAVFCRAHDYCTLTYIRECLNDIFILKLCVRFPLPHAIVTHITVVSRDQPLQNTVATFVCIFPRYIYES
jgi:hypothetical protein